MTLAEAVDAFIASGARIGWTAETRRKYRTVLNYFLDEFEHRQLPEISREDCERFLDRWTESAPATLALHTTIVRRFFSYLADTGRIPESPAKDLRRPPLKRPEDLDVVTVSEADVLRLFDACEDWQEVLCLSVLAYLGPRRRATAALRWRDVDLRRGTMRFREKGRKPITKRIPDELVAILRAAISSGEVETGPRDYVIPNRRQARNPERSHKIIYGTVKRIAERAGVTSHVHALRAAFAVRFLETHPGEIESLKHLLGHTRLDTTEVYLRRMNRERAMDRVKDLSWGAVFPPSTAMPPAGFEPALEADPVPEPIRRKLDELRARNREASRERTR